MKQLSEHFQTLARQPLADRVAAPEQLAQWTLTVGDIYADLSKNFVDGQTKALWARWWQDCDLRGHLQALRRGDKVNGSEQRPVLHQLLREPQPHLFGAEITAMREQLKAVAERLQAQNISDVVHIGIGGSELGMKLLCQALAKYKNGRVKIHFLAGTDGEHLAELQRLNPKSTALIIASKTFTTEETMLNGRYMRDWLLAGDPNGASRIVAISANVPAASAFGLDPQNVLPMWDWVGGRFSLSSALALPLILQNSYADYEALLAGLHLMDEHFYNADFSVNLPVLLASLDASYNRFLHYNSRAVITYNRPLRAFPFYLQQLSMESLGKNCDAEGRPLAERTGMIIWGGSGTETQHSFFQLLHQGNHVVPLDLLTVKNGNPAFAEANTVMHAHCIAQAEALMLGRKTDRNEQFSPGNRPSNVLILNELTPQSLGQLIAIYENKTSVEARLYGINAYDQWGVEYGKILAKSSRAALEGKAETQSDASTRALLAHLKG